MKKIIAFLFIVNAAMAASTLVGGTLSLNTVEYLPFPAQPGEYIDLFTGVSNEGSSSVSGVQCRIEPAFPFTLDNNEIALKEVGILAPRQGFLLKYKVRVDQNAVAGDNELKFSCKTESTGFVTAKMGIFVQAKEANLDLEKISVNPTTVKPGAQEVVTIRLTNTAKITLKDILATLTLNDTTLPFAPLGGGSQRQVRSLEAGESVDLTFTLVSSPEAELKVYKIPLTLSYYDALGKQYAKSDLVGIVVGGAPAILASAEGDLIKAGKSAKVTLRLNNAGVSDARFLTLRTLPVDEVEWLSNPTEYVGTISSDNYETLTLSAVFGKPGRYELPLELSYKDASNKDYLEKISVPLRVYDDTEAQNLGLEKRPDYTLPLLLVLAVGGYLLWRFVLKRKTHA